MTDSPEPLARPGQTADDQPTGDQCPPPPVQQDYTDSSMPARSTSTTTVVLALTAGALLLTTIAFAALWWSAKGERDDLQAEKTAEVAAANALPDLKAVADRYLKGTTLTYSGSGDSLDVTESYSSTVNDDALGKFLAELGFTKAVIDRMGHTRALDGTQTAEGRNVNVSWTYHPDDGLQMVFEVER